MARRRDWFEPFGGAYMALWWIPAGTIPTINDGLSRLWHHRPVRADAARLHLQAALSAAGHRRRAGRHAARPLVRGARMTPSLPTIEPDVETQAEQSHPHGVFDAPVEEAHRAVLFDYLLRLGDDSLDPRPAARRMVRPRALGRGRSQPRQYGAST